MSKTNQHGFTPLVVLLVIVFVGVVALIAWRAFSPSGDQTNNQTGNTPATNQQAQSDANAGYVVIKEWGVRLKPAQGVGTLQYRLSKGGENDAAYFSTTELANANSRCGVEADKTSAAVITRKKDGNGTGKRYGPINGYYFYSRASDAACTDPPYDLEQKTANLILQSFDSLEAAK